MKSKESQPSWVTNWGFTLRCHERHQSVTSAKVPVTSKTPKTRLERKWLRMMAVRKTSVTAMAELIDQIVETKYFGRLYCDSDTCRFV